MRLLVLGGTVFLSRAVAEEGVRRGHEVTAACRGTSGALPDGVRHVVLDRASDDPAKALAGTAYDAVVDVARHPSWVRRAVAATPGAHWVFVSTCNVYADTATPGGAGTLPLVAAIDSDEDPSSAPEVYGGMKVACEQAVRDGAASSTVLRSGLLVGPGDPSGRFAYWPSRLARGGEVLAPGSPDDAVQVVDVRDLAAWSVDCAERRTTGTFDAVGEPTGRASVLEAVALGVGVEPRLTWVPQEFLAERDVARWSGPRSLPLWLPLPEYAGFMRHAHEGARAAGLVTRPIADTARDTLAWLEETPDAPVTGLTADEEREVLAAFHAHPA